MLVLLVLAGGVGWERVRSRGASAGQNGLEVTVSAENADLKPESPTVAQVDDSASQTAFRAWFTEYRQTAAAPARESLVGRGREVAEQRRTRMARLIRENPEQALKESLRLDEYAALPQEVRALVERPFSAAASYDYYPVCGAPAGTPDHFSVLQLSDGDFDAYTFGRRGAVMSKRSLPVQGITLDGAAALWDTALRELGPSELAVARQMFPNAQPDAARSFATCEVITGEPVAALGGGKIYHFATRAELTAVNQALAKLDDLPGPHAGSDVLYQAKAADGSSASTFDYPAALAAEQLQADAWTETVKKVFMIRVDFSDLAGAPFTQVDTATMLNNTVSDQIRAMSYGKSSINAGVSANLYRMPQTSAYYVNGSTGSSLNSELLRDARNTFRNTRSGGDAAIDIGPVSNSSNGDGGGLGAYDIVGVLFASMNMRSSITYAGLAGGGNIWLQGTISASVFTHEFGHNYGLGHSSFWQTSDGSVTGTGSSVEYGDDYDIMGDGDLPKGHFHSQGKAKLNWLTTSEWSDATAGGSATYRLYRIDDQFTTGSPRGVRITRSAVSGSEEYFWLSFRPSYTGVPFFEKGAYMVWQQPGQTRSWLVDTTPATSGEKSDAPIKLGSTFADATSNAFITPLATGGSGSNAYLDVRVNFGPFPGNGAPTAGAVSGPSTMAARSSAIFTITASDPNGDTLAYAWNTGDSSVPGNAQSISQTWTVGGTYSLNVVVSDMKGGSVTVSKTVTVTDPLDTWTAGSVGSSQYLEQIVYAKGRYVSAEYFGSVFLSWDGATWSAVGAPPDIDQPKLAFGANVFVAAGIKESANTTAQMAWSVDGRRWNAGTFPNGIPLMRAVSFGNGRFTAVGEDGTVLGSTDGKSWSLTTVAGAPDFRHVAWTGSAWVAVAMHPTNARPEVVWTSPDGVTWTQRSARGVDTFKLIVKSGVCYALGWYGGVAYSTDHGVTFQDAALPSGTRWSTYLMGVAPDGTMLCKARAMDESGQPYALLVSTDGLRWVRASGNTTVAANAKDIAFGNGVMLTVEDAGVTRVSNGLYPANAAPSPSFTTAPATGSPRVPVYLAASATDANSDTVTYAWDFGTQADVQDGFEIAPTFAFGGPYPYTLRVSDGRGGLTTLNQTITINDPARTFTSRMAASAIGDLKAVAASAGRVVAVGTLFSGSFSGPSVSSTDGTTWTTSNAGTNRQLYAITHDGTQFVAAGERYDFTAPAGWKNWVTTSADGAAWTERYFTGGSGLRAVAVGGGVYVAAGGSGVVLRSTNGTTWSPVSIAGVTTGVTFDGLAWSGSVFLLTGYSGTNGAVQVFTSGDGLNWVNQSAGAGVASWQDLRKSAWLNNRFVSSGWYSQLRVSTNAGASFTTTRTDSEETPGLAYGGGIYFAAGVNHSASDADIDVLSQDGVTWYAFTAPTTTDRNGAAFFNNTFITVGNAGSIWQSATLTSASGFSAWQTTNFPSGGLGALAGRDPDNDGLNNLVEYALNLGPTTGNGAAGYSV